MSVYVQVRSSKYAVRASDSSVTSFYHFFLSLLNYIFYPQTDVVGKTETLTCYCMRISSIPDKLSLLIPDIFTAGNLIKLVRVGIFFKFYGLKVRR